MNKKNCENPTKLNTRLYQAMILISDLIGVFGTVIPSFMKSAYPMKIFTHMILIILVIGREILAWKTKPGIPEAMRQAKTE